ncbi:hypothetical protein ABPG72_014533 [Tetrahymena utriculariae]
MKYFSTAIFLLVVGLSVVNSNFIDADCLENSCNTNQVCLLQVLRKIACIAGKCSSIIEIDQYVDCFRQNKLCDFDLTQNYLNIFQQCIAGESILQYVFVLYLMLFILI